MRGARLEWLLAGLLHYGTLLASAIIALGLALQNTRIATAGIALLILLPSLRLFLMLVVFLQQRDYRFSFIAALVLTIVLLGFLLGLRTASAVAHFSRPVILLLWPPAR